MKKYPTDLTDRQFAVLSPYLPISRKRKWDLKLILDAIFYVTKSGVQWRMLPNDLPPWQTVYWYYRLWISDGTLDLMHEELRRKTRKKAGRAETPTAALIDSQSVKSSPCGWTRGYDAGKKINGVKRHIVTDTLGLLLAVVVHSASIQDRDGGKFVLSRLAKNLHEVPTLKMIFADGGYAGKFLEWVKDLANRNIHWKAQVIKRPDQGVFKLLPKRWVVERTFGWLGWQRRLARDYEGLNETSEAVIKYSMLKIMVKRF